MDANKIPTPSAVQPKWIPEKPGSNLTAETSINHGGTPTAIAAINEGLVLYISEDIIFL